MIRPKLCAFALTLTIAVTAIAADYKFLTPYTFDRKVDLQITGKSREYYALTGHDRVQVKVKGPTRLRVISRAVLDAKQDSTEYQFVERREGAQKSVTVRHRSRAFDNATVSSDSDGKVTAARSKVIDVPRGDQTYTFFLPRSSKQTVLLRFAREFKDFAQGNKIVAMTPVSYSARVDLVTKEEAAAYYRLGSKDNVKLQLIGPATLKVMTRIEFDQNMNGRQKWRVQVIEDGKIKATHSLSAARSQVTTYREAAPFVPSRAEALFVEVPEGKHDYEFRLPDNHRTVLFRFLLPEKQLERE
jgi:hypothetical protein